MGFECGFCKVKKFRSATVRNILAIDAYAHWVDNDFNRQTYQTFYDYCYSNQLDVYNDLPDYKVIEHYLNHRDGEYNDVPGVVDFWCSIGKVIDSFVSEKLEDLDGYNFIGVDKKFLDDAESWVDNKLTNNKLVAVQIINAYRSKNNKCGSIINCAGLEVMDEDGNRKFISSDDIIYVSPKGFDSEEMYAYEKFKDAIITMRSLLEDRYLLWYYKSY